MVSNSSIPLTTTHPTVTANDDGATKPITNIVLIIVLAVLLIIIICLTFDIYAKNKNQRLRFLKELQIKADVSKMHWNKVKNSLQENKSGNNNTITDKGEDISKSDSSENEEGQKKTDTNNVNDKEKISVIINDKVIANEYNLNQKDLHDLTKGKIDVDEFKTFGNDNIKVMNDKAIANKNSNINTDDYESKGEILLESNPKQMQKTDKLIQHILQQNKFDVHDYTSGKIGVNEFKTFGNNDDQDRNEIKEQREIGNNNKTNHDSNNNKVKIPATINDDLNQKDIQ